MMRSLVIRFYILYRAPRRARLAGTSAASADHERDVTYDRATGRRPRTGLQTPANLRRVGEPGRPSATRPGPTPLLRLRLRGGLNEGAVPVGTTRRRDPGT